MKTAIYLKALITSLLLSLLFHSCSNEEADEHDKRAITFIPAINTSTRSAMESGFEEGDKIGIFLLDSDKATEWKYGSECWASNISVEYTTSGKWISASQLYWQEVPYTLMSIAYYPYASVSVDKNFTNFYFQTSTDQSNRKALRQSDFLWASTTDIDYEKYHEGIPLLFNHLCCKLTLLFENTSNNKSNDRPNDIQVNNIQTNAIINIATGKVHSVSDTSPQAIKMCYDENKQTAEAIIIPQNIPAGKWINFKHKGRSYYYQLQDPLALESGKEYEIAINLSTAQ